MKLYGAFAIVILIMLSALFWMNGRIESLKLVRDNEIARRAAAEEELASEREIAKLEDQARAEFYLKLEAAQDENRTLRNAVNDATRRLSIRASCPRVPEATSPAGTQEQAAELDPIARQAYFDLRDGIAQLEAWATMCHRIVNSWGAGSHQ